MSYVPSPKPFPKDYAHEDNSIFALLSLSSVRNIRTQRKPFLCLETELLLFCPALLHLLP